MIKKIIGKKGKYLINTKYIKTAYFVKNDEGRFFYLEYYDANYKYRKFVRHREMTLKELQDFLNHDDKTELKLY